MKISIISFLIFIPFLAFSQQESTQGEHQTTLKGHKEWYKKTTLRAGLGLQRSVYGELGISRRAYKFEGLNYLSKTYYLSAEYVPTFLPEKDDALYGAKLGYEINLGLLAFGLESKYLTDFDREDVAIIPKSGFGVLGIVNLFYGYNFYLMGKNFPELSKHQFSIVVNL